MNEEELKARKNQDKKIRAKMSKDIQTDNVENVPITYFQMPKENKSGFGSNQRILFLIDKKQIGYLNQIKKNVLLPFQTLSSIPKLKESITFDQIDKVTNDPKDAKVLLIESKDKITKWKFICPSANIGKNWTIRIKKSMAERLKQIQNPPQSIIVEQSKIQSQVKNRNTPEFDNQNDSEQKKQNIMEEKVAEQNMPKQEENKNGLPQKQAENQNSNEQQNNVKNSQQNNENQEQNKEQKHQNNDLLAFLNGNKIEEKQKLQEENNDESQKETSFDRVQKVKEEYEKRKIEEKQLKQQIVEDGEGFINSLLEISLDTKLQIEKMKKQWGYEFAKSQNQYEIVADFKNYITAVGKKIVDELGLQEKKRYYQPNQTTSNKLMYEINGVNIDIYLIQLKEISNSLYEKGTMISNEQAKMAIHQFKNFDYILRLTHNRGKIRVPLSMVLEYKGFTIVAKAIVPSAEDYDNMNLLEKELEILEAESRINNSLFRDSDCGKIVALQSKVYEKLARTQSIKKKFDFCYVDELKYYLPHDFNNFSQDRPYNRLRWQLIQDDDCDNKLFYGEDMIALSSRLKLPQHYRDGKNQLIEISRTIHQRISILALQLESADTYFTNSHELSKIMHQCGINIRYLGVLLERLKQNWVKQMIMAEICARCAIKFLNYDLQDCLLNLNQSNYQNVRKFQAKQVIDFLNKMLGNSQETESFWKQINRQAQSYFQASIDREQFNQGYFIQAIQVHGNFKLNSVDQQIVLFDSPVPFTTSHFSSFETKTKIYDLSFTELYSSIRTIISNQSPESYDELRAVLNMNRSLNIPNHFKMSDMYDEIIKFLVTWLSPHQARKVYYPQQIQFGQILPSNTLYQIKLAEIRWGLKQGKIEESEKVKEWMIDHINKWLGDAHPILTELYELYANYHLMHKQDEKKSVNYCKTAIRNYQKLFGATHQKLADNYYLLGTVYLNYGKKTEAINTLNKARDIILKSRNENSEAYGQVCLKMAQLYLAINQAKDSIDYGLKGMEIFAFADNDAQLMEAIEIVCRAYEISEDWESYFSLIQSNLIHKVADFSEDIDLLEKIIKVCIFPSLKLIADKNTAIAQKIIKIMNELPETTRAPNMAYNFLKTRIQDKMFPHRFLQVLTDIEQVLEEIESNGMVARWKGFQNLTNKSLLNKIGVNLDNKGFNFIASLEALNIFIGNSFVEGILTDL